MKDDSVYVKVVSINVYGESVQSSAENGAVIQLVPDAPINLTNDASTTIDTLIRFTWQDGVSDGGNSIIDYTVYYDQGSDNYILLEAGVTTLFYQTSVVLTPGTTYAFKVFARNAVGSGDLSLPVSILAAKEPDAPLNLQNNPAVTTAYQVGLTWQEGAYNGGSAVVDYELSYKLTTS